MALPTILTLGMRRANLFDRTRPSVTGLTVRPVLERMRHRWRCARQPRLMDFWMAHWHKTVASKKSFVSYRDVTREAIGPARVRCHRRISIECRNIPTLVVTTQAALATHAPFVEQGMRNDWRCSGISSSRIELGKVSSRRRQRLIHCRILLPGAFLEHPSLFQQHGSLQLARRQDHRSFPFRKEIIAKHVNGRAHEQRREHDLDSTAFVRFHFSFRLSRPLRRTSCNPVHPRSGKMSRESIR